MVLTRLGFIDTTQTNNNTSLTQTQIDAINDADKLDNSNAAIGSTTIDRTFTGGDNILIGTNTGADATSTNHSVIIGTSANSYNTASLQNVGVGIQSKAHSNAIAIGSLSEANAVNSI